MAGKFDWQTEDEEAWADPPPQTAATNRASGRWGGWLLLLVLLAAAVGAAVIQLNQRVQAEVSSATADVLASFRLHQRAVEQRDDNLFRSIISGRDGGWANAQLTLFAQDLQLDRRPLGLAWLAEAPANLEVTVSPDLLQAEVAADRRYVLTDGMGGEQVVVLRHTAVYRRGRIRWLAAAPTAEFWGEWMNGTGQNIDLVYPERDQGLALRLLPDLDAQVERMCRQLTDIECPSDLRLAVRLSDDPGSLLHPADPSAILSERPQLALPAPSLVGVPQDETGYQAMLRGYTIPVVARAITRAAGWQCCEQGLFFQALLDVQLDELALRPWPLTPQEYGALFNHPVLNLTDLRRYWDEPPLKELSEDVWRQVYALVEYQLSREPTSSAAALQRRLTQAEDYDAWLGMPAARGFGVNNVRQRAWLQFIQSRIESASLPAPLPAQEIQALCDTGVSRSAVLLRYDLLLEEWMTELSGRAFMFMGAFPEDDGILIQERQVRLNRLDGILWRGGQEMNAFHEPLNGNLFRVDQAGSGLLLHAYDFGERSTAYTFLDLQACDPTGCQAHALSGLPVWSPDGAHTLIAGEEGELWLGDDKGQTLMAVGRGAVPFWLDAATFGYVQPAAGSFQIMLAKIEGAPPRAWLSAADLAAAVTDRSNAQPVQIHAIVANPQRTGPVFIAATAQEGEGEEGGLWLFSVGPAGGEVRLRWQSDNRLGPQDALTFSPDGRWLTVKSFAPTGTTWQLTLLDTLTDEQRLLTTDYPFAFPGFDWSADGRWLLLVGDGYLHLYAPAQEAHRLIVHEYDRCNFAAWIESR
ncbi:MAG: TolB family protein [Anaerolineae bacterium]